MARSINNIFTRGLRGMVGGQMVFRSWNGKTYLSVAPSKPRKQSKKQKENRTKFKLATMFAKAMMKDPVKKAEYKVIAKKLMLPNAYTAAITEYMRNPEIHEIDASGYRGREKDEIKVVAGKKGFELQEVEVIIVNNDKLEIERGLATKGGLTGWIYRAKSNRYEGEYAQIIVMAKDKAGNYIEKVTEKALL